MENKSMAEGKTSVGKSTVPSPQKRSRTERRKKSEDNYLQKLQMKYREDPTTEAS